MMVEKTERFSVKLLPTDKQALMQLAREEGESMAFVIRKLIRKAGRQQRSGSEHVNMLGSKES